MRQTEAYRSTLNFPPLLQGGLAFKYWNSEMPPLIYIKYFQDSSQTHPFGGYQKHPPSTTLPSTNNMAPPEGGAFRGQISDSHDRCAGANQRRNAEPFQLLRTTGGAGQTVSAGRCTGAFGSAVRRGPLSPGRRRPGHAGPPTRVVG